MSNAGIKTNSVVKNQPRMKKYVVEAPEPKPGQKLSSGGIREKGKMAVTFKNPVPLEESKANTQVVPAKTNYSVSPKKDNQMYWELGKYLIGFAWRNFGEPVVGAWLQEKSNEIAQALLNPSTQSKDSTIIDVEEDDVVVVSERNDKVVQFPANDLKKSIQV